MNIGKIDGNSFLQNVSYSKNTKSEIEIEPVEKIEVTESTKDNKEQEKNTEKENEKIKDAINEFNKRVGADSEAIFGIHEKTNRVTIKIVDKKSKDVIKEFPPDKTLDMIAKVWELAGIMVDEKK